MTENTSPGEESLLRARAYLSRAAEPPARPLWELVKEHGAIKAADLVRRRHTPAAVAQLVQARAKQDHSERDLTIARSIGARLVVPEHEEWPGERLVDLAELGSQNACPPLALWVRGAPRLSDVLTRAVAVVGARAASSYGEHVAAECAHDLALRGHTVISGAAYGIDGAAHRGSLGAARPTVALLACGIDVGYPAGHTRLINTITENGLVISEYPPTTKPMRHRFLVRNRLIAALTDGTVVVEAGARSGSRNTAHTASMLGRVVMAMPGPVTSARSVGCHEMVRSGMALLVCNSAEVIEAVSPLGEGFAAGPQLETKATDELDGIAARIYDSLAARPPREPEWIASEAGVPVRKVRAVLPALEIAGLVQRTDSGWIRHAR